VPSLHLQTSTLPVNTGMLATVLNLESGIVGQVLLPILSCPQPCLHPSATAWHRPCTCRDVHDTQHNSNKRMIFGRC
jgi:hypothetical protein